MSRKVLNFIRAILFVFTILFNHMVNVDAVPNTDDDQAINGDGKIMLLGEDNEEAVAKLNQELAEAGSDNDKPVQLNEEDDNDIVIMKDQGEEKNTVEQLNNPDSEASASASSSSSSSHETIKKFKQNPTHLWDLKKHKNSRIEAGFDLTPEEMEKFKIWKNGVVPYYIDVVSFDKVFRDQIRRFLQTINAATRLNFVELLTPPTDENERWAFFINRRSLLKCTDHTVKNYTTKGVQQVVLGYDCMATRGELAEAVMALAGVSAQHNAPDRDKHITVNMENIMPDKQHLFEKLKDDEWLFHDLEYDFDSITHYDSHKYSAKGHITIELKDDSKNLNPTKSYSPTDLLKLKMLYNYIAQNNKIQGSDCQKLFQARNKFERVVANKTMEKPRKKPSRYTGIHDEVEKLDEEIEQGDNGNKNTDIEVSNKDEDPNEEKKAEDLKATLDETVEEPKDPKLKHYTLLKKVDALAQLSDYNSGEIMNLKKSKKKQALSFKSSIYKRDPLSYLSDYQTGQETERKKVLKNIQANTMIAGK